ncbi:MAG: type II toxin-antitoxin system death-on-curing family toxin [Thermoleophilaceae bacterium]
MSLVDDSGVRGLDLADYLLIAEAILDISADRLERTANLPLVESALAAPFAGFGDHERYPDLATKAAVLCSRLVRNHPLPDGNKRIAYICMRELIARNDHPWRRPPDDEAAEMIEQLAARTISEEHFATWVARHLQPSH